MIWAPETLSESEAAEAAELGPSEVLADGPPGQLMHSTGFVDVVQIDMTTEFETTVDAMMTRREEAAEALRRAEGEDRFEEEQRKGLGALDGIRRGLLRRCLVVGRVPGSHAPSPSGGP